MQRVIFWTVTAVLVGIAIYYFSFVYERANYQHPMKRTSEISLAIA